MVVVSGGQRASGLRAYRGVVRLSGSAAASLGGASQPVALTDALSGRQCGAVGCHLWAGEYRLSAEIRSSAESLTFGLWQSTCRP